MQGMPPLPAAAPDTPDLSLTTAHLTAKVDPKHPRFTSVPPEQRNAAAAYDAMFKVLSELEWFNHAAPFSIHTTQEPTETGDGAITAVLSFPVTAYRLAQYQQHRKALAEEKKKAHAAGLNGAAHAGG